MSSEYIIELDNVSKYFGSVIALKNVSMGLRRGEVHCLPGTACSLISASTASPSVARSLLAVNNCSIICYASLRRTVPCDTEARREGQREDNGHQFVVSLQLLGEHIETERGKENDRV